MSTRWGSSDPADDLLWRTLGKAILENAWLTLWVLVGIVAVFGLAGVLTNGHGA